MPVEATGFLECVENSHLSMWQMAIFNCKIVQKLINKGASVAFFDGFVKCFLIKSGDFNKKEI